MQEIVLPNHVLADYSKETEHCLVCGGVLRGDVVKVGCGFRHPADDKECKSYKGSAEYAATQYALNQALRVVREHADIEQERAERMGA